jgi:UrcA family protein
MTKTLKSTLTAAALVAVLGSGAALTQSAQAGSLEQDGPKIVVSYADLNIATRDGAKVLYERIGKASKAVCDKMYPPYNAADGMANWKCQGVLVRQAVKNVNTPALTAVYLNKDIQVASNR